jgi:hypothetical protein
MTRLHECPRCQRRRTSKKFCVYCTRVERQEAKERAAWKALPGTPLNLGAAKFLDSIQMPDLIQERYEETWPGNKKSWPALRLMDAVRQTDGEYHGIEIRIVLTGMLEGTYDAGSGHTNFDGCSFDRVGVDDSFHVEFTDTAETMRVKIAQELEKIRVSRERRARSEKVPGLPGGWLVTPETKAKIGAALQAGRRHSFTPSGFGTGYNVGRAKSGWATRLPDETSQFFGVVGPLYYETMDCD